MESCIFYSRGHCRFGASCKNRHDPFVQATASDSALPDIGKLNLINRKLTQPPRATRLCIFFQKGICTKGSRCTFAHAQGQVGPEEQAETSSTTNEQLRDTVDSRNSIPCRYFSSNSCQKGQHCPFLHEVSPREPSETTDPATDDIDEHDGHRRYLLGALIHFGEDGQVVKVSLNSDFSSVRIVGLLGKITQETTQDLIRELRFELQDVQIRAFVNAAKGITTSIVTVEDAEFAKSFDDRLKIRKQLLLKYSITEFGIADNVGTFSATNRRTSSRKVRISWQKPPPRRAWLNFGSEMIATRVGTAFNSGQYKILECRVRANPPQNSAPTFRPFFNRVPVTLVLNDIPHAATYDGIMWSIPRAADRPRRIELGDPSYEPSSAIKELKGLFARLGSVEFHELPPKAKYFNASIIFQNDSDALEAVQSVKGQRQDFLKGSNLIAKQLSSAKFKVSTSVYTAVRTLIEALEREWTGERFIHFKYFDNSDTSTSFTTIKLEGETATHVAQASNSLEKILEGKILQYCGSPFWSSALASNGEAYQAIQEIQRIHQVVIIRNRARKELKYFGPLEKHTLVEELITAGHSDTDGSNAQEILLSKDEFAWACQGGIKKIISNIGAEAVSFDVVSVPKKILITGTPQQFETAVSMVRKQANRTEHMESSQDCSICWTDAEGPVVTKCGHLYCLECFGDMCSAAGTQTDEFRVRCQGDMGNCKKPISLGELQDHLSSTAVEELLHSSFKSHINRHRELLKYCPTPDCEYLYRPTENPNMMTCTKCLQSTCTKCHQQHGLLSCADYRDLQCGGYEAFEKLKKQLGIKDCPKCKTPMEKTDGCNHMTCVACGTHICWVCLKTFDSSGPCYAHMAEEHGGHTDVDNMGAF